jgi:hypothetical protein
MTYNILCDSPFVPVADEDGDLSVGAAKLHGDYIVDANAATCRMVEAN